MAGDAPPASTLRRISMCSPSGRSMLMQRSLRYGDETEEGNVAKHYSIALASLLSQKDRGGAIHVTSGTTCPLQLLLWHDMDNGQWARCWMYTGSLQKPVTIM
eukprot:scaffold103639_cov67-Attheya_sp.AAC.4